MAQESNIHDYMGWIWTALGVIGAGIVGSFRWLFNLNNRIKDIEANVTALQKKDEEIDKTIERISKEIKDDTSEIKQKIDDLFNHLLNMKK